VTFFYDDVTVTTSFIGMKFCSAATKFVQNEQHAVVRFFCVWANELNASKIHSSCPVYGDKCFTKPARNLGQSPTWVRPAP